MPYPYNLDDEIREYKEPKLQTNRAGWKLVLFNILTLVLYSITFFIPLTFDLEKVSPSRDRGKIMNYLFAFIIAFFTFSVVMYVWHYQVASRIEDALAEREIDYDFSTNTFWLWYVFGSLFLVGPIIYFHKFCKAMNLLCEDFNNKNA